MPGRDVKPGEGLPNVRRVSINNRRPNMHMWIVLVAALAGVPVKGKDFALCTVENSILIAIRHNTICPRLICHRSNFDSNVMMNQQVDGVKPFAIERISPA